MNKDVKTLQAENEALKAQLAEQSRLLEAQGRNVLQLSAELSELRQAKAAEVALEIRKHEHIDRPTVPAVAMVPLLDQDGKPTHYWEAREYDVPTTGGRSVVPKGDVLRHPEAKLLAAAHLREVTTRQGREAGW